MLAYRILADLTLVIHLAFVVFAVLGGLLALRWRRSICLHLPAFAWGVAVESFNLMCPLTYLENRFRHLGGEAGYAGDFIQHFVPMVLYPPNLTREFQFALALALLAVNLAVYTHVFLQRPRRVLRG